MGTPDLPPIRKIPHPIIACRFSCDYTHEGDSLLCVLALQIRKGTKSKVSEILHPGEYLPGGLTDNKILECLNLGIFRGIQRRVVYAIEDSLVLRTLLSLEHLRNDAKEEDEGSFEYSPLGDYFSDGICGEVKLFHEHGIELMTGRDDDLLRVFTGEKSRQEP